MPIHGSAAIAVKLGFVRLFGTENNESLFVVVLLKDGYFNYYNRKDKVRCGGAFDVKKVSFSYCLMYCFQLKGSCYFADAQTECRRDSKDKKKFFVM